MLTSQCSYINFFPKGGKFEEALKHLESSESQIPDKLYVKEKKGTELYLWHSRNSPLAALLMKLGRQEDAVAEYKTLIKINPENYNYFVALKNAVLFPNGSGRSTQDSSCAN